MPILLSGGIAILIASRGRRLARGEHQNYFYPDFVICLSHYPGDAPLMRLIETKESLKDAERKARRVPKRWGKVLFLTRDQARLRVINDDGSLGVTVDYDDLTPVREWLRESRPAYLTGTLTIQFSSLPRRRE